MKSWQEEIQGYKTLSILTHNTHHHLPLNSTHRDNQMKIQCDMCEKTEAAVYCTADEASLCHGCDRRVHHANKVANKHPRFSLHSSSDQPPCCDICQEKRAFLFCKEDRAILCRECDISIHRANELTKCHNRFLLAGVKLSDSSSVYDNSSDQTLCSSNSNGSRVSDSRMNSIVPQANNSTSVDCEDGGLMDAGSISEYLTETLPGWHVEEFHDPCASNYGFFYQGYDSGACTLPFMAHDSDNNGDLSSLWSEDLGVLDHQNISRSKRVFSNEIESMKKMNKDQHIFNSSSIKRPRQLW